jgi:ribosomal protein S18 acetylase RimI-like enzyme
MTLDPPFRRALIEDAPVLAELVNYAGDGLPLHLWSKMAAPGESAWEVGRRRAARPEGGFSYRNTTIVEHRGVCAGCLIGYEELENLAPGTWYVNVLAVRPQFRGLGLGTRLLDFADEAGRARGKHGMSVIVSDANPGARRLYQRCGYREVAARTMVKDDWQNDGRNWVLLTKAL